MIEEQLSHPPGMVLFWLSLALSSFVALAVLYHVLLAFAALVFKRGKAALPAMPTTDFAILIPAHDEEVIVEKTLESVFALDYPGGLFTVYVVADNCTDKTAEVARRTGAKVLERFDTELRGKGYALEWSIPQVLNKAHDAVFILDADCLPDKNALTVFDEEIQRGNRVLQCKCRAKNPDDSPSTFVAAVGNVLESDYFYSPKSDLGLFVFLGGTGMVLSREVLLNHPWNANSVAEDSQYTINLLRAGIRARYVGGTAITTDSPQDFSRLKVQRTRWAEGNLVLGKRNALMLLLEGIRKLSLPLFDAGWTMLVMSRPLVILELLLALILSLGAAWSGAGTMPLNLVLVSALLLAVYFAIGLLSMGLTGRRLILLLETPGVVLRLGFIAARELFGSGSGNWAKTPRKAIL